MSDGEEDNGDRDAGIKNAGGKSSIDKLLEEAEATGISVLDQSRYAQMRQLNAQKLLCLDRICENLTLYARDFNFCMQPCT